MTILRAYLAQLGHRWNLWHGPLSKVAFHVWGCDTCGKIADADRDDFYAPYDWRPPKEGV